MDRENFLSRREGSLFFFYSVDRTKFDTKGDLFLGAQIAGRKNIGIYDSVIIHENANTRFLGGKCPGMVERTGERAAKAGYAFLVINGDSHE
jgi:hypothetical protein